ncbi:MAG: molybdopterin molybdotransferase MoeA, partial [Chloroflexi bacterium]|nr:molybdopterin molybdotransferase MoeA [Chloroflexota bacterium]
LPGQIRNTNACSLAGLVTKAGAVPLKMGIVRDNRQALELAVRRGLEEADMVVISAGSSVSTRDITADVVDSLGRPGVIVHGVSVRPGKPTILASVDGKAVFGLPGNPGSAMVIFELFVMPSIHLVSGCTRPPWRVLNARLTRNVASAPGRVDYVPVRIEQRSDELHAEPLFGKSNTLSNLIEADGLAEIPLDRGGLMAGEMVMVRVF